MTGTPELFQPNGDPCPVTSPAGIGEAIALDEWRCRGRALVVLPKTYARAIQRLLRQPLAANAEAPMNEATIEESSTW